MSVSDTIKVIVTETYKDLQRDITQHAGDTFEVTKERAAQLIEAGVAKQRSRGNYEDSTNKSN